MNHLLADIAINTVDPTSRYNTLFNLKPSNLYSGGVNIFFGVAGLTAFIYLLWGGYTWITAGGDKEGTEKARKRLTSALIGLALVFSVYALLYIVQVLFNIDIIGLNIEQLNAR